VTFDHKLAAKTCDTCHSGSTAKGKSSAHIPTTAQCDVCHADTTPFTPAKMNHTGTTGPVAAGNCASCHGPIAGVKAKSASHIATTAQCDVCHKSTTSFSGAVFDHASAKPPVGGRCDSCHGVTAGVKAKSTSHLPTTAQCDTCHKNTTAFKPATMNHGATNGPLAAGNCVT